MAQTKVDNADPVALAAELRPLLARNAVQTERDRRLPEESVKALEASNLFNVMTPPSAGADTARRSQPRSRPSRSSPKGVVRRAGSL
jgi:hypothetical protein